MPRPQGCHVGTAKVLVAVPLYQEFGIPVPALRLARFRDLVAPAKVGTYA